MRRTPIAGVLLGVLLLGATGCGSTEPPPATEAAVPVAKWTPEPELPIFASPDKKRKPIPESKRYRPEKEPTVHEAALRAMPSWCRATEAWMQASTADIRAMADGDLAAARRYIQRTSALAARPGLPATLRSGLQSAARFGKRIVATKGRLTERDRPLYEQMVSAGPVMQQEINRSCVALVQVNR